MGLLYTVLHMCVTKLSVACVACGPYGTPCIADRVYECVRAELDECAHIFARICVVRCMRAAQRPCGVDQSTQLCNSIRACLTGKPLECLGWCGAHYAHMPVLLCTVQPRRLCLGRAGRSRHIWVALCALLVAERCTVACRVGWCYGLCVNLHCITLVFFAGTSKVPLVLVLQKVVFFAGTSKVPLVLCRYFKSDTHRVGVRLLR